VRRRWAAGLTFGPGEALRLYLGRPGFATLLARQRLPLGMLGWWLAGVVTAVVAASGGGVRPLAIWLVGTLALVAVMTRRKRSPRLALHSLLTWSVNGLGVLVGFARPLRAPVGAEGRS
jgi:hypothetical protein